MPETKWQKIIFAFITVVFTVHLFVFYNLSFVNGLTSSQLAAYGVPILGRPSPVWMVIVIEFVCAFGLELLIGSPGSLRIAFKLIDPRTSQPLLVETIIICATVVIMCPAMSFLAVWLYSDLSSLTVAGFLAAWLKTVMHNFPLALFSQVFFIQPLVRAIYGQLSRLWGQAPHPASQQA